MLWQGTIKHAILKTAKTSYKLYIAEIHMRMALSLLALLLTNIPLLGMDHIQNAGKTKNEKILQKAANARFLKAARKDHLQALRQVLKSPYVDVNTTDCDGNSALHLASTHSEQVVCTMIKILVDRGLSPHTQNQAGQTPLHAMAAHGHAKGIALLLEQGVSVHTRDKESHTPLFYCALQPTNAFKALLEASASIDREVVTITDNNQNSVLHLAARNWPPELIPVISRYGVNINAQNKAGKTPLHNAVTRKSIAATEALVKEGALLDICDEDGNTPLHIAVRLSNTEIEQILVKAGARLNIKNKGGISLLDSKNVRFVVYKELIAAIEQNDNQHIQKLLDQGLNPNFPLQNELKAATTEQSLLSVAMKSDNAQAVCLLLDAGANAEDAKMIRGGIVHTPLGSRVIVADSLSIKTLKAGQIDMAQLLLTHIPKPLLDKHINEWIKPFISTLICSKRMGKILPSDIRKLLFKHCMISTLLPEQSTAALNICNNIPWDTESVQLPNAHKDKFDGTKITQYHPIWETQVKNLVLHKKKK